MTFICSNIFPSCVLSLGYVLIFIFVLASFCFPLMSFSILSLLLIILRFAFWNQLLIKALFDEKFDAGCKKYNCFIILFPVSERTPCYMQLCSSMIFECTTIPDHIYQLPPCMHYNPVMQVIIIIYHFLVRLSSNMVFLCSSVRIIYLWLT